MAGSSVFGSILGFFRRTRVSPTETIGTGGTATFGGYVVEREKNRELIGRQKNITFSNLLANVSVVATGTRYFLNLIAKASWKFNPADDSPQAQEFAERAEMIFDAMATPIPRIARRAAMFRFYGFSIQEWTAMRMDDGTIGFLDIEPRPQITIDRWDLDERCRVLGAIQRSPQTQEEFYLPRQKIVYIVDDTLNDSPEGLGLFRHIVKPARRLQRYEDLEAIGFETDLRGIPVTRAPFGEIEQAIASNQLTKEKADLLTKSLDDFVANRFKSETVAQGLVLPSDTYRGLDEARTPSAIPKWGVELLQGGISNQAEAARAIQRINLEIARVMGIEGQLLGDGDRGSEALSRDKSHNLGLIVDSTLTEITDAMTKDAVQTLWSLNGWPPEMMPTIMHQPVQFRDVEQITKAIRDLAESGAILAPDDPAINDIRELLGISPADLENATLPTPEQLDEETDQVIDDIAQER